MLRSAAETERLKRELVEDFRTLMLATADRDAAITVAIIKFRQLLDIIYPPEPRNDMADALAYAWQADAGAQDRADHPIKDTIK
jgi:hypothetical protein